MSTKYDCTLNEHDTLVGIDITYPHVHQMRMIDMCIEELSLRSKSGDPLPLLLIFFHPREEKRLKNSMSRYIQNVTSSTFFMSARTPSRIQKYFMEMWRIWKENDEKIKRDIKSRMARFERELHSH